MTRVGGWHGVRKWFIHWLKDTGRPGLNRFLVRYSLVGDPVVFDPASFPWTAELEANWRAIRQFFGPESPLGWSRHLNHHFQFLFSKFLLITLLPTLLWIKHQCHLQRHFQDRNHEYSLQHRQLIHRNVQKLPEVPYFLKEANNLIKGQLEWRDKF